MNFKSMKNAMESVQMLQEIYDVVHILDEDGNEVFDDTNELFSELTVYKSPEYAAPQSGAATNIVPKRNVTLSINEETGTAIITTTVPVLIDGRSYCLELIQHTARRSDDSRLTSDKDAEQNLTFHHIRELTITDSLTKLYNRRYIDEQLPLDLTRSFEKDKPLSVIYADIDYFKRINDQYGHIAGDRVLKKIADIFRHRIRKKDGWAARYGGEEFLICLPEIDQKTAIRISHRIRRAIELSHPMIEGQALKVTCSFGVQTVFKKSNIKTVDEIVALVDKKLYEAKRSGRNRVIG